MTATYTWALILAAGEGSRLSTLTTDGAGLTVPKQFCSLNSGASLLQLALERARSVVPRERICVVVAEQHRHWWRKDLASLPTANVIVQPRNRGTGNGILLPLFSILARDPLARMVVLPSDHYVGDEEILRQALRATALELSAQSSDIVLLGIVPEEPDHELGYILPGEGDASKALPVRRFVEKPPRSVAAQLIEQGGLWNSLIFAANALGLFDLFCSGHRETVMAMQAALAGQNSVYEPSVALRDLYERLPNVDFSRHVLENAVDRLRVRPVSRCGWTDLGTVRRVAKTVRGLAPFGTPAAAEKARFDLATALRLQLPEFADID
jgi:mannose-1-phosphate guanylyltransferase